MNELRRLWGPTFLSGQHAAGAAEARTATRCRHFRQVSKQSAASPGHSLRLRLASEVRQPIFSSPASLRVEQPCRARCSRLSAVRQCSMGASCRFSIPLLESLLPANNS